MAKPVIALRLEPIESIVEHEKKGILFDQADESSLKNAIVYLMENDEKRGQLAALAHHILKDSRHD